MKKNNDREMYVEVQTFIVSMSCANPECNGEMKRNGQVLTSYPPKFGHECTVCKTVETFDRTYPDTSYLPKQPQE